jgi:hypothetical protein
VKRPPGRKRRGSAQLEPLPLSEWDFKNCPVNELSLCRAYEYTRSSTLIRESVARLRAGQDDALSRAVQFVFPINLALSLPTSPWWPQTPYLDIPEVERAKLISAFGRPEGAKKSRENLASLVDPFVGDRLHDRTVGCVIAVYVPRGQQLGILRRAFTDLLRRDYPDLLERTNRSGVTTPGSDRITENLKFLSMWRLWNWGYTAQAAIKLAAAHKIEIYNDVRAYRRAVAGAERRIRKFEDFLRQLAATSSA